MFLGIFHHLLTLILELQSQEVECIIPDKGEFGLHCTAVCFYNQFISNQTLPKMIDTLLAIGKTWNCFISFFFVNVEDKVHSENTLSLEHQ